MSSESAVVTADKLINWPVWGTRRELTLEIDPAQGLMTVSHPSLHIGNGNLVAWTVESIPGYTVEIELGTKADPAALSQGAGTTVEGNIKGASTEMTVRVDVTYSVFLKSTAAGSRTKLQRVGVLPVSPILPILPLPDPAIMIDRMGDPPV